MSTITPGTWVRLAWTSHAFTTVGVVDDSVPTGFRIVAECATEDDARLIAEAKQLLAALNDLLTEGVVLSRDYLASFERLPSDATIQGWDKARWLRAADAADKARAVIAKATGGAA